MSFIGRDGETDSKIKELFSCSSASLKRLPFTTLGRTFRTVFCFLKSRRAGGRPMFSKLNHFIACSLLMISSFL
ncbi:RFX-like DNA-binding protein [Dirofilaria immitis]